MDKFKTPTIDRQQEKNLSQNKTAHTLGNIDDNNRNFNLTTPRNIPQAQLINDVTVYSWGRNEHGELGLGTKVNTNTPQPVKQLKGMPIQHISTG